MYNYSQQPYQFQQPGAAPNPQPKMSATQPITPEMSKMLNQNSDVLSVKISAIDNIKAQCTHKNPSSGAISLINLENGRCHCSVCGEEWNIMDTNISIDEVKRICDNMISVLQSIKTYHVNAPVDFTKEFYQIINLIKRVPDVWNTATSDFLQHESYHNAPTYNIYPSNNSAFAAVGGMLNAPFMPYQQPQAQYGQYGQYGQQPQYAPQQQQQQYAQPPVQYQQPQAGYGQYGQQPQYAPQPQYGQQPQAPVYPADAGVAPSFVNNPMAFNEQPVQQQVAPVAAPMVSPAMAAPAPTGPAMGTEVVQTKSFSV